MSNRVIYPLVGTAYAPGVVQVDPSTQNPVPCLPALGPLAPASSMSMVQATGAVFAVAMPRKTSITGVLFATASTTNNNLLDPSGVGAWLDVRDYNTLILDIASTATTGSIQLQGAFDAAGNNALPVTYGPTNSATGQPAVAAITPSAGVTRYRVNVSDVNYLRANLISGIAAGQIQCFALLSQVALPPLSVLAYSPSATNFVAQVAGPAAESSSVNSEYPVIVGGFVRTSTSPTNLVANDAARLTMTSSAALVNWPYAVPEISWQAALTLTNATATAAKAAGAALIRNYVTGLSYQNSSATATTVTILDGATVLANFVAPANMALPAVVPFQTPLRGTAATALNVQCGTTGSNTFVNIQGVQAI